MDPTARTDLSRRRALAIGGAASLVAASSLPTRSAFADPNGGAGAGNTQPDPSTTRQIQSIIGAEGSTSNGVFTISIARNDIQGSTIRGVPIKPAFEISGELNFQKLPGNRGYIMNSDMPLKTSEVVPFIDQLLKYGIVFQAEHQHYYDIEPINWFIHFRGVGDPIALAKAVKQAINVTSTPFPQTMPKNPTTSLPADAMGKILGAKPSIGADGVVSFDLPRKETIHLGGYVISNYLNVTTAINFEPLPNSQAAAGAPDFAMIASEIQNVIGVMRQQGWDIGCLYNQETAEDPQLFYSHQIKTGDPLQLAREIRKGLNYMNLQFM